MPLTVPPFSQFQGNLFPLRGLWHKRPAEGDYFVNAEVDWGSQNTTAIQFALSGNSPVAMSQIVALYIDNRRCGVDTDFLFPDSGFLLTVPAHAQGLFPVLTNALMFYAIATGATTNDVTIVQILNSLPYPIPLLPSVAQNNAALAGLAIANGTLALVPAGISGTLNAIALSVDLNSAAGGTASVSIQDGTGAVLWAAVYNVAAGGQSNIPVNLSGMNVRFKNGLNLVISGAAVSIGFIDANVYYSTP
jgi:hypothetical protein